MYTETIKLIYSPVSLLTDKQTNKQQQQKDEPDTQTQNTIKNKTTLFFIYIFAHDQQRHCIKTLNSHQWKASQKNTHINREFGFICHCVISDVITCCLKCGKRLSFILNFKYDNKTQKLHNSFPQELYTRGHSHTTVQTQEHQTKSWGTKPKHFFASEVVSDN